MHRRKQPPQPLKTMTDQELTFDQLQTIAGGHPCYKLTLNQPIKKPLQIYIHEDMRIQQHPEGGNIGVPGEPDLTLGVISHQDEY